MMKAVFQLILKWNVLFQMGMTEEECLKRKKVEFVSDASQTGRGGSGHSQKETRRMKSGSDSFSQQLGSSAYNSVILSLISGQIEPVA
jgi:hypothetical protein